MAKTLIIHNDEPRDESNKVPAGKSWLTGVIWYKSPREAIFEFYVQHPDGREELYEYGRINTPNTHDTDVKGMEVWKSEINDFRRLNRDKALQRLINRLENEGYSITPKQIALFMSQKTPRLILTATK